MTTPEFSHTVRIDTLGATPRHLSLEANGHERSALAARFGLEAIDSLSAEVEVTRSGEAVTAKGSLHAHVTQSCVATNQPVEAIVDEPFALIFRPLPLGGNPEEEIELSEQEMDVVFYDGASIDIGESVAETLSLSLDPYPRSPEADAALREAGVKSEEEAGAFGALAALKDKLAGKPND